LNNEPVLLVSLIFTDYHVADVPIVRHNVSNMDEQDALCVKHFVTMDHALWCMSLRCLLLMILITPGRKSYFMH